jgi:hypothetical protein
MTCDIFAIAIESVQINLLANRLLKKGYYNNLVGILS